MTHYVGIDQSYTGFGVVALHPSGEHIADLWQFPASKYARPEQRLLAIEDALRTHLQTTIGKPRVVCMEGYAHGAKFGREQAGELGWAVKRTLFQHSGPAVIVSASGVKKFATGKGTGVKKNQMLLAVYKRWDVEFSDDNLADAYVLARIAAAFDGQDDNLTTFQKEVLAKL